MYVTCDHAITETLRIIFGHYVFGDQNLSDVVFGGRAMADQTVAHLSHGPRDTSRPVAQCSRHSV